MKGSEYLVLGLAGLAVLFIVRANQPAAARAQQVAQQYDANTWATAAQLWARGTPTATAWNEAFPMQPF